MLYPDDPVINQIIALGLVFLFAFLIAAAIEWIVYGRNRNEPR